MMMGMVIIYDYHVEPGTQCSINLYCLLNRLCVGTDDDDHGMVIIYDGCFNEELSRSWERSAL